MKLSTPLLALGAVVAVTFVFGGYQLYAAHQKLQITRTELGEATSTVAELTATLATTTIENTQLTEALENERNRNDAFQERIDEISGTVGKLDKLSKTDPELLQKYSKVYFLNENYTPSALSPIPEDFRFQEEKVEEIHASVLPHLMDMLHAAKDDTIDLLVASSYRSFGRQAALKSSYVVRYGTGANAFSAEQGYSEHQLGTTVDLTTEAVGGSFAGFDQTEAFEWLTKNAHKYGFVLSYPKGNSYYQYEPWHWRFVGKELADDLHDDEKNFYDLDQRVIDPYLINFFD